MATSFLQFTSPAAGSTVEESITVSGTDGVTGSLGKGTITHSPITVQFGADGPSITATPSKTGVWTCTGSVSANAASGPPTAAVPTLGMITITASGSVTYPLPGGGETQFETDSVSR